MKLIINENHNICGIYKITNIKNNKFYIGSTKNILKRIKYHEKFLKSKKHPNDHLQRTYNKYKTDAFEMVMIENCIEEELLIVEQKYLNLFHNKRKTGFIKNCYNIEMYAGMGMRGRKHKLSSKEKMSSSKKGIIFSQEHKDNLSKSRTGEKNHFYQKTHNTETKEKISKANSGSNNGMYGKIGELNPGFGKHLSEEHKQKLSIAGKGKQLGEKNPMFGIKGINHISTKIFNFNLYNQELNKIIYGPIIGIRQMAKSLNIDVGYFGRFLNKQILICKDWILIDKEKKC